MGLRETLEENQKAVVIAAAVLLVLGVVLLARRGGDTGGVRGAKQVWFYDLGNGELYARPPFTLPPETAPSGGQGVKAHVYTCGTCSPADRFVVYLETYSDADRKRLDDARARDDADLPEIMPVIARPPEAGADPQWLSMNRPEGMALYREASTRCDGAAAQACYP